MDNLNANNVNLVNIKVKLDKINVYHANKECILLIFNR